MGRRRWIIFSLLERLQKRIKILEHQRKHDPAQFIKDLEKKRKKEGKSIGEYANQLLVSWETYENWIYAKTNPTKNQKKRIKEFLAEN